MPHFSNHVLPLQCTDAERNELVVHNPHGCQVILYDNVGQNGTIKSPGYPIAYVPYVEFSTNSIHSQTNHATNRNLVQDK